MTARCTKPRAPMRGASTGADLRNDRGEFDTDRLPCIPDIRRGNAPVNRHPGLTRQLVERLHRRAIADLWIQLSRAAAGVRAISITPPPGRCAIPEKNATSPSRRRSQTTNSTGAPSIHSTCGRSASISAARVSLPRAGSSHACAIPADKRATVITINRIRYPPPGLQLVAGHCGKPADIGTH